MSDFYLNSKSIERVIISFAPSPDAGSLPLFPKIMKLVFVYHKLKLFCVRCQVLDALTPENLCALLKKSGPDDSLHIALEVLRCQVRRHTAKKDGFLSPYRTAVWMVLCYDKSLRAPEDALDRLGCPGAPPLGPVAATPSPDGAPAVDWREVELADALVWASTHMQDMLTCRSDDEPRRRTALLCATLALLTRRLIAAGDLRRSPRLWGGMFAPLLRAEPNVVVAAREEGVGSGGGSGWRLRDADLVQHVALYADDANGRWADPVPALWAIAHGRGTAAQVGGGGIPCGCIAVYCCQRCCRAGLSLGLCSSLYKGCKASPLL
jgi:hypothetical protein